MRYVIDCITATRSARNVDGRASQHIEFAIWLNVEGLTAPVTARVQPTEVRADSSRPLTPPIPIGPIVGTGSHQHSGAIADIAPGSHHRLTVRVHDGYDREYVGSLDITRDDCEAMATDLGPLAGS